MKKIPLNCGDELDALSKSRKHLKFKRGLLKKIKRRYNKRFRQAAKSLTKEDQLIYIAYYEVVGSIKLTPQRKAQCLCIKLFLITT